MTAISPHPDRTPRRNRRRRGGAAVEFAIVFPAFFVLLYGMVNYGLLFALQQSMIVAAEDGARAAVACDPTREPDEHALCVGERARAAAVTALGWLPEARQELILGAGGENVIVEIEEEEGLPATVSVLVEYPSYSARPLLPPLMSLSYIDAQIPPLPDRLAATSVVRL